MSISASAQHLHLAEHREKNGKNQWTVQSHRAVVILHVLQFQLLFKFITFKSNFRCSAVETIESSGQLSVSSVVWVESWRRGVAAADRMTLGMWDDTTSTHHHEHIKHAEEQSTFADKAASLGLLVTLAAKACNEELYKLLLFVVTQLEWLACNDSNHVQFSYVLGYDHAARDASSWFACPVDESTTT